jgi:ribosome-binding protein aMBF1 (putative translation factor)
MTTLEEYIRAREARDPAFRAAREADRVTSALADALIHARVQAGLTQEELAYRPGTTQSAVARLESGTRLPTVETLQKLAQVLGLRFVLSAPQRPALC